MRDETDLSSIYLPFRSSLPAWEALGLVVNVRSLAVQRQGKLVTHLSLEVHRFLLRPIIRALPWPREHLYAGPAEQIAGQERLLLVLHDALLARLGRRLRRLAAGQLQRCEDVLEWHDLGEGWLLHPAHFSGLQERVWRGPDAERWNRPG